MYQYRSSSLVNSRQQRMWRRNQNVVAFEATAKLGPVTHTVLMALMIAVLGLIYLTQVTKTGTYGYPLHKLDDQRTELISKKNDLERENARLQAFDRVQNSSVAKAYQAPSNVDYVRD